MDDIDSKLCLKEDVLLNFKQLQQLIRLANDRLIIFRDLLNKTVEELQCKTLELSADYDQLVVDVKYLQRRLTRVRVIVQELRNVTDEQLWKEKHKYALDIMDDVFVRLGINVYKVEKSVQECENIFSKLIQMTSKATKALGIIKSYITDFFNEYGEILMWSVCAIVLTGGVAALGAVAATGGAGAAALSLGAFIGSECAIIGVFKLLDSLQETKIAIQAANKLSEKYKLFINRVKCEVRYIHDVIMEAKIVDQGIRALQPKSSQYEYDDVTDSIDEVLNTIRDKELTYTFKCLKLNTATIECE
jgi:hypothetical protein